jgi:hypothetical protein
MRCTRTFLAVVVSLGMIGSANSAVVYSENFEDETVNAYPSIGGSNVGSGYTAFTATTGSLGSRGTYSIVANPELIGNTSAQVLRGVRDNAAGGGTLNQLRTVAKFGSNGVDLNWNINGLDLTFDFYVTGAQGGTGTTTEAARVALVFDGDVAITGSGTSAQRNAFNHNQVGGNSAAGLNDSTNVVGPVAASTWYRYNIRYTLNDNPSNATIQYDAAASLTNLETSTSVAASFVQGISITNVFGLGLRAAGLMIETSGDLDGFTAYYDNFSVSAVPEPASFALMGIVSVGAFVGVVTAWKRR